MPEDIHKRRASRRRWAQRNRARLQANARKWRAKNPERNRTLKRQWEKRHPEKHKIKRRRYKLKKKYGLTIQQFNDLLAAQGFMCKSCGDSAITPSVDHCHKTGIVRAILCRRCNLALGIMEENHIKIKALAKYAESLSFSSSSLREEEKESK